MYTCTRLLHRRVHGHGPCTRPVHSRLYGRVHDRVHDRVCMRPVYTAMYMARTWSCTRLFLVCVHTAVYTYVYTQTRNDCLISHRHQRMRGAVLSMTTVQYNSNHVMSHLPCCEKRNCLTKIFKRMRIKNESTDYDHNIAHAQSQLYTVYTAHQSQYLAGWRITLPSVSDDRCWRWRRSHDASSGVSACVTWRRLCGVAWLADIGR